MGSFTSHPYAKLKDVDDHKEKEMDEMDDVKIVCDEKKAEEWYQKSLRLTKNNEHEEAFLCIVSASDLGCFKAMFLSSVFNERSSDWFLLKTKEDPRAFMGLSLIALKSKNEKEGYHYAEQCFVRTKSPYALYRLLFILYYYQNNVNKAKDLFNLYSKLYQNHPLFNIWNFRLRHSFEHLQLYYEQVKPHVDFEGNIECIRFDALYSLAVHYFHKNLKQKAREIFLRIAPFDPQALHMLIKRFGSDSDTMEEMVRRVDLHSRNQSIYKEHGLRILLYQIFDLKKELKEFKDRKQK